MFFAWKSGKNIQLNSLVSTPRLCIYGLTGPLFFGSARKFLESFDPHNDPDNVIIDFKHSKVCDQSELEAIKSLSDRYFNSGKRLHLKHLSTECERFLKSMEVFVGVNVISKPQFRLIPSHERLGLVLPELNPKHHTRSLTKTVGQCIVVLQQFSSHFRI